MFVMGYHLYEWDQAIENSTINKAKELIDLYGEMHVLMAVCCLVPARIKNKQKLLDEIKAQLIIRKDRSWNRGHVRG